MDSHSSAPELSSDPTAELGKLIARSLALQEEALTVSRRIRQMHEQLSQRGDAARELASTEAPA